MGFGVFVMARRQMLGIRDRAERLVRDRAVPAAGVQETESFVVAPEPLVAAPA